MTSLIRDARGIDERYIKLSARLAWPTRTMGMRFGVFFKLGQGVQLGKHLQAQKRYLVDNHNGLELFVVHQLMELIADALDHDGLGQPVHERA